MLTDMPTPLTQEQRQRYARHLSLNEIGVAGQERLAASSVLVVGAGGLGSPAALYLAAAGVGTLGLIDHDRVELSNLQRQVLFTTAELGAGKAETARNKLCALNPSINVVAHSHKLERSNIASVFKPYDVIIDGTDRLAVRYLINDACVLMRKPLVSAAIHRFEGQAMTYLPGRSPCYRCLYPDTADDLVPNCADAGVLGVLPGVMGSLQATEAIKVLLSIGEPLAGRLLVYDALALEFQEFKFKRRVTCAVCGDHPSITSLDQPSESALAEIEEWTVQQLAAELAGSGASQLQLVDVRETHEWMAGRLPGAVHIPLATLPQRAAEISPAGKVIFICAAGGRSMAACRYFGQQGRSAINLAGGMHAWAATFGAASRP
jgi:sulfur-carrier protein adenylyltransferase/sulfurtransferase